MFLNSQVKHINAPSGVAVTTKTPSVPADGVLRFSLFQEHQGKVNDGENISGNRKDAFHGVKHVNASI